MPLAWDPQRNGDFKLNVDGMRKMVTSDNGVGGVIRNSIGEWIGGFSINLGKGQIMKAEL